VDGEYELFKTTLFFESTAQHPEWLGRKSSRAQRFGRRLNARQIYRAYFLTTLFRGDVTLLFRCERLFRCDGSFFRFLDTPVGVATPVLTASLPSAVPMASAAVLRNGVAGAEIFFFAGMASFRQAAVRANLLRAKR
jgi:hypothetical protein